MKVIINADGRTCTTVNPLGKEEPIKANYPQMDTDAFMDIEGEWYAAQSERQTFEISNQDSIDHFKTESTCCGNYDYDCKGYCAVPVEVYCGTQYRFEPGTTHSAEIVNGKAVIK